VIPTTLNLNEPIKPLGLIRLRIIEFLSQLVKLNKPQINEAIEKHNILEVLINLVQTHPWNNLLQLKTQMIFEDLLESEQLTRENKFNIILKSNVVPALLKMSENTKVTFTSSNQMRHGYMGFAIKLSNLIKKKGETEQLSILDVEEKVFNVDWLAYVDGELTRSNNENARNLGGRPHSNDTEEEETN